MLPPIDQSAAEFFGGNELTGEELTDDIIQEIATTIVGMEEFLKYGE